MTMPPPAAASWWRRWRTKRGRGLFILWKAPLPRPPACGRRAPPPRERSSTWHAPVSGRAWLERCNAYASWRHSTQRGGQRGGHHMAHKPARRPLVSCASRPSGMRHWHPTDLPCLLPAPPCSPARALGTGHRRRCGERAQHARGCAGGCAGAAGGEAPRAAAAPWSPACCAAAAERAPQGHPAPLLPQAGLARPLQLPLAHEARRLTSPLPPRAVLAGVWCGRREWR